MYKSESIINNLLIEVDSLSYRITNIHQAYFNTSHVGLRDRLFYENKNISQRLNEIFSIAKVLKNRNNENISFSSLLVSFENEIIDISNQNSTNNQSRVKAYILKNCPWSKRSLRLLDSLSIPHEAILIENDKEFQKVNSLSNHNTFPQIFLDDVFFGGYDELSKQAKHDYLNSFK